MATTKQTRAAKRNVQSAQKAASKKRTITKPAGKTRGGVAKQATGAQRKRTGGTKPKTRAELYEIAKKRDLPGRSTMRRDELARKLRVK